MRLLSIAALLLHLPCLAVEPQRPPSGQSVDESREVALRTEMASSCLAFKFGSAMVLVDKAALDALMGAPDDGHMAELNRKRASLLLNAQLTAGTVLGCPLAVHEVSVDRDYLLLRQVELGEAAVIAPGSEEMAPHVVVRYSGSIRDRMGGGVISVALPGVRPFFVTMWWVT